METYQQDFIELAISEGALRFGEFTLKSGRTSPYFFNAGLISSGSAMRRMGAAYAETLKRADVDFDVLLGPAYKGIPLATAMSMAYSERYGGDIPFAYNRKEAKSHGEGGTLVGAPLEGRVVIVDDVITAGTAIRGVIEMLDDKAQLAAVVVGLDRQEKGQGELSAIQELEKEQGIPVLSIVNFDTLLRYMEQALPEQADLTKMREYRQKYGVNS